MATKRLIRAINDAIAEEMERDARIIVFGEDVELSIFGDTKGLRERFGPDRVRNTPICETLMSGMAVGAAASGYRVICHLMFGNFTYTALDAIANQAAKLRYMTNGQIKLPIVYMALMGGGLSQAAQHSDSVHPLFMNLGGLKVVVPTTPFNAQGLMKSAIRDDNPVMYLQPARRGGERGEVPDTEHLVPLGVAEICRPGRDLTIVAVGSMVKLAHIAASNLAAEGIEAEVIDPRTLVPLDEEAILASVRRTGRLVVVDEARESCGAASQIAAVVAERAFASLKGPVRRITVRNLALPYAPALERLVLPSEADIVATAKSLLLEG